VAEDETDQLAEERIGTVLDDIHAEHCEAKQLFGNVLESVAAVQGTRLRAN